MTDDDSSDDGGFAKPAPRHREAKKGSDADLVKEVRFFMKTNKLSQVTVGQEARISQAVISQWLSLKYHGHNDKVRTSAGSLMAAASECVLLAVASLRAVAAGRSCDEAMASGEKNGSNCDAQI